MKLDAIYSLTDLHVKALLELCLLRAHRLHRVGTQEGQFFCE